MFACNLYLTSDLPWSLVELRDKALYTKSADSRSLPDICCTLFGHSDRKNNILVQLKGASR